MKLFFGFGGEKAPNTKGEEYKQNYHDKDSKEYDPYANPLEAVANVPGTDVVDPENYYNEPGLDKPVYNDLVDDSQPGGEIGELMEKYGLEEWELAELMKKSEAHLNGRGIAPLSDAAKVKELAGFYREYLGAKNEHGLPFSAEEMAKISDAEADELADLYEKRSELALTIANLNSTKEEEAPGPAQPNIVYTTAPKTKQPIEQRKGTSSSLTRDLEDNRTRIMALESKLLRPDSGKKLEKGKDSWQEVPEYSPEELALRENCLAYFKNRKNPRPTFSDGKALEEAQILEVVQEAARDGKWPNGNFFEESHKGRRQLSYIEKFGNKRVKYVHLSESLPAGKYFFESDPSSFFVSKNNANAAVAPVRTLVTGENPKKFLAEKEARQQKGQKTA